MSFIDLLMVEAKKLKRSKIMILLIIPIMFIMISAICAAKMNLNADIKAHYNMFIQSILIFVVFLLPLSMVVINVLLVQNEQKNRGIIKMLSLPVSKVKLNSAKLLMTIILSAFQVGMFFILYIPSEYIASSIIGVNLSVPIIYLLKWCIKVFIVSIPMTALFYLISLVFKKPALSLGLGFLFVVPNVIIANTKLWNIYPVDYGLKLIMIEQGNLQKGAVPQSVPLFPWVIIALAIFIICLVASSFYFEKTESM